MVFGPKSEAVASGWRELHSDDFHDLYSSLNVITMIKSGRRRLGRAGGQHGTRGEYSQGFGWKTWRQVLHVEGMIILKWKLKMMKMGRHGLDSSGWGYSPVTGSCDHGKLTFGFHKIREISWLSEEVSVLVLGKHISSTARDVRHILDKWYM